MTTPSIMRERAHVSRPFLAGKTALVTGGSRGIGRVVAQRLAAAGAVVAVNFAEHADDANEVVSAIQAAGGRAFLTPCRLKDEASVQELKAVLDDGLIRIAGRTDLDILVNNVGNGGLPPISGGYAPIDQTTEAIYDDIFTRNAKIPFFVTKALAGQIKAGGIVINVSSAVARLNWPAFAAYSMAKAALEKLTVLLAKELGAKGIRVNAIAPGVIETPGNQRLFADAGRRRTIEEATALGRLGLPEDVAELVLALVSPAMSFVTGQSIEVSGGYSL